MRDSDVLAALMTQLGYPTAPQAMTARLARILEHPGYRAFVAEVGGRVVGMAGVVEGRFFERDGTYGQVVALVVDEAFRRQGVGATLVRAVEAWLRDRGATAVVVNTSVHRTGAHRFYESVGYESTGLRFVKDVGPHRQ